MRWLLLFAIVIAGATLYLWWTLGSGDSSTVASSTGSTDASPPVQAPAPERVATSPGPIVRRPVSPTAVESRRQPSSTPAAAAPAEPITPPSNGSAGSDEVPDTEEQRNQRWYTANARLEGGNYPGALEAALELVRRHPSWAQDGWSVAIPAYCALDDAKSANALFAKLTDERYVGPVIKKCAEWNITLVKP